MTFTATQALKDAQLSGGIDGALDDDPTDPAYALLFDVADVALVTLLFAKPAATLVAHFLVFAQGDPTGDLILNQGSATHFELYTGSGVLLGTGDVTDMLGTGALKISGTTGTLLYAGARAILGELKFGI